MSITNFIKQLSTKAGSFDSVRLAHGEWAHLLVDPNLSPREGKFGNSVMLPVHERVDVGTDPEHPQWVWAPRTLYCRPDELHTIAKLCADERCVLTVSCTETAVMDKRSGEQMRNQRGGLVWNKALDFEVYADSAHLGELDCPTVVVPDVATADGPAPARAGKPRPKPLV